MNRVPPPEHERVERLREECATESDAPAKNRRARIAESQEKILAMYADTFRRLAE